MLQINGLDEGLEIFRTLGSDVRMRIVQLLAANGEMNMNELAEALDLTNGAVTSHVRKLEQSGIIGVKTEPSGRGTQKVCSLLVDQLLFSVHPAEEQDNVKVYETQIGVGLYSDYSVKPGCGLAGAEGLIGPEDDAFSFTDFSLVSPQPSPHSPLTNPLNCDMVSKINHIRFIGIKKSAAHALPQTADIYNLRRHFQ